MVEEFLVFVPWWSPGAPAARWAPPPVCGAGPESLDGTGVPVGVSVPLASTFQLFNYLFILWKVYYNSNIEIWFYRRSFSLRGEFAVNSNWVLSEQLIKDKWKIDVLSLRDLFTYSSSDIVYWKALRVDAQALLYQSFRHKMAADWNVLPHVPQAHLIGNTRNSYIFFSELFRWFSELLSTWKCSNSSSPCFQTFHICIGKWLTLFTAAAQAWPPLLEVNCNVLQADSLKQEAFLTGQTAGTNQTPLRILHILNML